MVYLNQRKYNRAISSLLEALEIARNKEYFLLLGKIYLRMAILAGYQNESEKHFDYLEKATGYFSLTGQNELEADAYLNMGWYHTRNENDEQAILCARKVIELTNDSLKMGEAYVDIGKSYIYIGQYDSSLFYIRKSLDYPYKSYQMSVRYFYYACCFQPLNQLDSLRIYLHKALEFPMDIYFRMETFSLLAEVANKQKDNEHIMDYVGELKMCQDSILKIESQSNIVELERIHQLDRETVQVKTHRQYLMVSVTVILIIASFIIFLLYRIHSRKKKEVIIYKSQLKGKEVLLETHLEKRYESLLLDLHANIKHAKEKYAVKRAKLSFLQREQLDREIYDEVLHYTDEKVFFARMNNILNHLPDTLKLKFPDMTYKEILFCCLTIIEIPTQDICLILEYKQTSLYKFKQRLIKKLGYKSSKEFESILEYMIKL